jgi:hypothetical protein
MALNPSAQALFLLGKNIKSGLSGLGDQSLRNAQFDLTKAQTEYEMNDPTRRVQRMQSENYLKEYNTPVRAAMLVKDVNSAGHWLWKNGDDGFEPSDAYGLVQPGSIDVNNRPVLKNSDGSISTEKSISIGIEGGKEVLIPTIINGKEVSKDQAIDHYRKTGEHLGVFKDVDSANQYAKKLHNRQGRGYGEREPSMMEKFATMWDAKWITDENDPRRGQLITSDGSPVTLGNMHQNAPMVKAFIKANSGLEHRLQDSEDRAMRNLQAGKITQEQYDEKMGQISQVRNQPELQM